MIDNENFKAFNNLIETVKNYTLTDMLGPPHNTKYDYLINSLISEINWNKMQKNIDFKEYLNAIKYEILKILQSSELCIPKIQKWEKKYNFKYPDNQFISDPLFDEFDFDQDISVYISKDKDKDKSTPIDQQDINNMQKDFTEYSKIGTLKKVLEIIEVEENNYKQVEKWTVATFALFLYFLKKGDYEISITKKQLEKELMKKYNYSLDIDTLNNTIIYINKRKNKDPLNIKNLTNVMPHLVKYPLSLIKASEMLIELCKQ